MYPRWKSQKTHLKHVEQNEKRNTMYQNVWFAVPGTLKGKPTVINMCI